MPIVLKSGRLNLLELSGPVQACNGLALPFYIVFILHTEFHSVCMCTVLGKIHRDGVDVEPSHDELKMFIV